MSWLIKSKKEDETKKNLKKNVTKLQKIRMATCYTTDLLLLVRKILTRRAFLSKSLELGFHIGQFIFSSYLFLT